MKTQGFMRGYNIGQDMYKTIFMEDFYESKLDDPNLSGEEKDLCQKGFRTYLRKSEQHLGNQLRVIHKNGSRCIKAGLVVSILGHPIKYRKAKKIWDE